MSENDISDQSKSENHVSLCDLMKNDTSEVMRKLESQIPSFAQNYSDLYAAYLHMFDNFFGACYISEKEFFDKLKIDQKILLETKKNSELIKKNYFEGIDSSTKFFDFFIKTRISGISSVDNYIHEMMELYSQSLSQFNKYVNLPK
ncbi:MAG: hypothetical protein HW410_1415 [Nitrosarchaeum sp.]|nr:hypothetical protein [Nitrosarchaeum sp.]